MRKKLFNITMIILAISSSLYGTFELMNARTFQLFGGLTNRVNMNENVVALTFDDGPTENVKGILPLLKKYNAKASFL